jgi:hypothetical protein
LVVPNRCRPEAFPDHYLCPAGLACHTDATGSYANAADSSNFYFATVA